MPLYLRAHTLVIGVVQCTWLLVGDALIPTKTAWFWNQFLGSVPFRCRSFLPRVFG
jgi:hypothetical protein